jgi:hypothetical protein
MGKPWEPPVWPGQYRPHTMTPDCWCVCGLRGMECRMTEWLRGKTSVVEVSVVRPEPGDGGPPF